METIQRAGWAARDASQQGLFLLMYEPWAVTLVTEGSSDAVDPDRPFAGIIKKNSTKQDRTGLATLKFIQSSTCLRAFFARYLGDDSPTGFLVILNRFVRYHSLIPYVAQDFSTHWCCDRHPENGFDLSSFFPGPIYHANSNSIKANTTEMITSKQTSRPKLCPVKERDELESCLISWRRQKHETDPLCSVRSLASYCDDTSIKLLSKTPPSTL